MNVSNSPLPTQPSIHTVVSNASTRNIFRLNEECQHHDNTMKEENMVHTRNLFRREDGDIFLSPSVHGNKLEVHTSIKCEDSPVTNGYDESSTLRPCMISFSSDEEDVNCDIHDMTTPLDYRRDWSHEMKDTLQVLNASGALLTDESEDNYLKCGSIASFDIELDTRYELECQPLSEWIQGGEGIIW